MANEYLKRTPTSAGNRKVFTWAGWVRRNENGNVGSFFSGGESSTNFTSFTIGSNDQITVKKKLSGSNDSLVVADPKTRDPGSWYHIVINEDYVRESSRIFLNGVEIFDSGANFPSNTVGFINAANEHRIGNSVNTDEYLQGEMSDVFFVDGQALTPDVFGFNKEGKGYISVGSTQATDFRPGQWLPKSPRVIKTEINRRGGFGVNGFYLPMNDSSNFGADFHCAPNSIIKLKGEDLPQPRNGLPTTSDNYVSQLRSDPYAANLVLAVPGVNTQPTGSELVTNGTFDTNVSGWTVTDTGSIVRQSDGTAKVTRGSSAEVVYQDITTVVGTTYELSVDVTDIAGSHGQVYVRSTYHSGSLNTTIGYSFYPGTFKGTFTADTTTTRIILYAHPSGSTSYDNISVKATTIPDYHADIKGSGTNKTLIPYADANVSNPHQRNGRNVNGYYGSALSFDGSDDYIDAPASSDYNLGTGDYTIECWINPVDITTSGHYKRIWDLGSGLSNSLSMTIQSTDNSFKFRYNDGIILESPANTAHIRQWSHVVLERYGSKLSLYLNGVVVDTITNHTASYNYSSNTFRIGRNHETSSNGLASTFFGYIQDFRFYKGVAKYKVSFDVSRPYSPENGSTNYGIETWRQVPDNCKNNFATWNSVSNSSGTLSEGNLSLVGNDASGGGTRTNATIAVSSGKWYFEVLLEQAGAATDVGIAYNDITNNAPGVTNGGSGDYGYLLESANTYNNNSSSSYGSSLTTGDIFMCAFDVDTHKLYFGKNGSWFGSSNPVTGSNPAFSITSGYSYRPVARPWANGSANAKIQTNFGQNPAFGGTRIAGTTYTDSNGRGLFKYQPPTGFLAMCEDNLPTPAIADPGEHFKTVLYSGSDDGVKIVTGVGFQPDFVWVKNRYTSSGHYLWDVVRGANKNLRSDGTFTESAVSGASHGIISTNSSNGFVVKNGSSSGSNVGSSGGDAYVAWCWKAGGEAVTNTDGTITSQVSANQTAGFSIVSYTGTGSAGTVGHGLGKAPSLIITKHRAGTSAGDVNWNVSTSAIPGGYLELNRNVMHNSNADRYVTGGTNTNSFPGGYVHFNDSNRTYISYCWAEIDGYSKIGTYIGNQNADGPFVYCGFKPAFLLLKIASPSGQERDWHIYDSARNSVNTVSYNLRPSAAVAEYNEPGIDFLSNGFKLRQNYIFSNYNGGQIFFAAFAESPFQTANAK